MLASLRPRRRSSGMGASSRRASNESTGSTGSLASVHSLRTLQERRRISVLKEAVAKASNHRNLSRGGKGLTLNQLRLSNLHLHGRSDDMDALRQALRRSASGTKEGAIAMEAVLVAGASGTGKSALIEKAFREPMEKSGGFFIGGKFDLKSQTKPYSAVGEAFSALGDAILERPDSESFKADIVRAVGLDGAIIAKAIGSHSFREILLPKEKQKGAQAQVAASGEGVEIAGKESVRRLQYAFRRFIRAICNRSCLVLFLDDLQWADVSSLELIQCLAMDGDISSMLLVGAYRDNEIEDAHPLSMRVREMQKAGVSSTTIQVGNLDATAVSSLVAEVLRMDEEDTNPLAAIVLKKTDGNAFFVLQFLTSLQEEGLLHYNFGLMRWTWDVDTIQSKGVTDNVAMIMVDKLRRYPTDAQETIKVASCLGATFEIETLQIALDKLAQIDADARDWAAIAADLPSNAAEFISKGLLDSDKDGTRCSFAHDQIQEAAFRLIPSDEQQQFPGRIGEALVKHLSSEALEECLFETIDLCNLGGFFLSNFDEKKVELAKLNLRAGQKAANLAAFDAAASYLKTGRALLGPEAWEKNLSLMLDICSEEAKAHYCNSDLEDMQRCIDDVLRQDIPIKDKFPVYQTYVLSLHAATKFDEAIGTVLSVRRQLGFKPFPKKITTTKILADYLKTRLVLRNSTMETLSALPILTDEKHIMGQQMLELLLTSSYQARPQLYPLVGFRMVRSCVRYGVNRSACDAFVTFGILLCGIFGHFKEGADFGKVAEATLDRLGARQIEARLLFITEGLINHWTSPLQGTLQPLLKGYQVGLETGDLESACWSVSFRSSLLWFSGRPLQDLERELKTNVGVLEQMKQTGAKLGVLPFLQATQNLLGLSSNPKELTGNAMDYEEVLQFATEAGNMALGAWLNTVQLELYVFFQDFESARLLLEGCGDVRKVVVSLYYCVRYTFLEGLVSMKAAKKGAKKRMWKSRGKKSIAIMRKWLKNGNVNCVHAVHLLEAELASLKGEHNVAKEQYDAAILTASRSGFLQDKSLAHELAGLHYLNDGDVYWASYNLERAHLCYSEWQAKAKADDIAATHASLLSENGMKL